MNTKFSNTASISGAPASMLAEDYRIPVTGPITIRFISNVKFWNMAARPRDIKICTIIHNAV